MAYNRINYGIHSICPIALADNLPYGIMKVIGGGTLTMASEFEELFAGSSKFAWAVEAKTISTEWTASVKMMNDFMFELFLGATVSTTAASALGTVGDFANVLRQHRLMTQNITQEELFAGLKQEPLFKKDSNQHKEIGFHATH